MAFLSILWKIYIFPVKIISWIHFAFPKRGELLRSSRDRSMMANSKMYQFIKATAFWFTTLVVLIFIIAGLVG